MSDVRPGLLCKKLQGKIAVITGASAGLGKGVAIHFSSLGAKLTLNGRNEVNLTETANICEKNGIERPACVLGDLTEAEVCEQVIKTCVQQYGRIDILVNAAGTTSGGSIEDVTLEDFDSIMDINVRMMFHLTKIAVPYLIESKGCVVNVSSVYGMRPVPDSLLACVSKSAVDHMTRCSALDLASKGVRINAVNPSGIPTTIYQRTKNMSDEAVKKMLEGRLPLYPLGRLGTLDDLAGVVAFLASDEAAFVTGVTIPVDGGRHLK